MLNANQKERFEKDWDAFLASYPDGLRYTTHDENNQRSIVPVHSKLREFTQAYIEKHNSGCSSQSAFQIVLDLLVKEGDFKPIKTEPDVPAEFAEYIRKAESGKISTYELRRRYMSDRAFRDAYDVHSGLASFASQPATLIVEQYRSMPSAVVQKRYRQDPTFKAAVDALLASGRL